MSKKRLKMLVLSILCIALCALLVGLLVNIRTNSLKKNYKLVGVEKDIDTPVTNYNNYLAIYICEDTDIPYKISVEGKNVPKNIILYEYKDKYLLGVNDLVILSMGVLDIFVVGTAFVILSRE